MAARSFTRSGATHAGAWASGRASCSRAGAPIPGDTVPIAAMTLDQNRAGSLWAVSIDSHAMPESSPADHQSRSREVFPPPAGATTRTSFAARLSVSRSSSACLTTVPGRAAGGCRIEAAEALAIAPPAGPETVPSVARADQDGSTT